MEAKSAGKSDSGGSQKAGPSNPATDAQPAVSSCGKVVIALYNFSSKDVGNLSFKKGDRLLILNDSDNDWWHARHQATLLEGYIPSNFVARDKTVESEDWFFGKVSRKDAEKLLLQSGNERGTFLVRNSEQPMAVPGAYSLSMRDWDQERGDLVKHYRIRCLDNGGVFITTRHTFDTLQDLIVFYSEAPNGLCYRLTKPCKRPKPHMWDLSPETRDKWEIDPKELTIERKIGSGNFGEVFYGKWRGTIEVAIKSLKKGAVMSSEAFLQEASIMKTFRHDKIVSLYAICSIREPIYIVTEFMSNGALLDYLRSKEGKHLKLPHLVDFAAQIASGMMYLEGKQLVHRDLAARNILVGDHYIVKVADFGLARVIEDSEYTAKHGSKFPVKWTAPEAIYLGKFTVKSDVWSYGIVLMEIITHGHVPYPGMSNREVMDQVEKGYRMPKPQNVECPDSMYDTMLECWDSDPNKRPTFKYLFTFFDDYGVMEPRYRDADDSLLAPLNVP